MFNFVRLQKGADRIGLLDTSTIFALTAIQCIWMSLNISIQIGLLNLLPTAIFLSIWYLFVKLEIPKKYRFISVFIGFLITLRLPLTVAKFLEPLSCFFYLIIVGLLLYKIASYYKANKNFVLLVATSLILLFNSLTHISLNSPYTYVNRSTIDLKFECPYESPSFMVNCDFPHYIAEEKIFTDPEFDASFSVLLRRFFYGYLSSLISFDGHRWIANFALNLLFWLFACVALYKIVVLTQLGDRVAAIAMLCCASSWGFVSFVGQPSMHMTAYAYASILLWASLEMINSQSFPRNLLLALIIVSGSLVYDIYAIALAVLLLLLVYRKAIMAVLILSVQILSALLWNKLFLEQVLGTTGNPSNAQFVTKSITTWFNVLMNLDFPKALHWLTKGFQTYIYGGMIVGAIASFVYILRLLLRFASRKANEKEKLLLLLSFPICFLVLASAILVALDTSNWSHTGTLPRLAFYAYSIHTIALILVTDLLSRKLCLTSDASAEKLRKPFVSIARFLPASIVQASGRLAYIIPAITFLIANLDLTGLASVAAFFDYGFLGIYWKQLPVQTIIFR